MEKECRESLEDVVSYIIQNEDYQECIRLKEQMSKNEDVVLLVEKIKSLQKKYIRNHYSMELKKELDELEEQLNAIPIYHIYNEYLVKVNEMIEYVKDELNDYFYQVVNLEL